MSSRTRGTRARGLARLVAVVLAATAVMATGLVAVVPAVAATAGDEPDPVVFILDASGSMVREVSPGVSRMDVAKRALTDTLEALPDGTEAGVLVFGTGTGNDDAERTAGCSDVKTLIPFGPVGATTAESGIANVIASGFTPIGPALRQAFALLPTDSPGNIVLISDGIDTCSPPSSCEVAAGLHRDHPLISINVVAFGVDDDEAAQQQMTCIGGVGGGNSVAASDPDQLIARLRAVAETTTLSQSLSVAGSHGVALGMTLAEVRARVDGAKVGAAVEKDGVQVVYVDCGWGTVELHDGRVWSIALADDTAGTAEGLVPGDAFSKFVALYGQPVSSDAGGTVFQLLPGSATGYRVTTTAGSTTVRRIVVCRCVPLASLSPSVADWDVSFEGVGPLFLGMTIAEARTVVPELVDTGYGSFDLSRNGQIVLSVQVAAGTIAMISVGGSEVAGSSAPQAHGIRLGDTGATAVDAFPGGSYLRISAAGVSAYLVADRSGRLLTFDTQGGGGSDDVAVNIRTGVIERIVIEDAVRTRAPGYYDTVG